MTLTGDDHGFQVQGKTRVTVSRRGIAPADRLQMFKVCKVAFNLKPLP